MRVIWDPTEIRTGLMGTPTNLAAAPPLTILSKSHQLPSLMVFAMEKLPQRPRFFQYYHYFERGFTAPSNADASTQKQTDH